MSRPQHHAVTGGHPTVLVLEEDGGARSPSWSDMSATAKLVFCANEKETRAALLAHDVELIVMEDSSGNLDRWRQWAASVSDLPAIPPMVLLTTRDEEALAVEALENGALDCILRRDEPQRSDLVRRRLERALDVARLQRENARLRQSIEESQARLFNVYDSLDDVIMQIDEDCRIVSLNRSAAALANIEPRDGIGKVCHDLFDFFPSERRDHKDKCPIYRTFVEGETLRGERYDSKTHEVHQYMTFITTLKGRDYTVYRESDITEKRRLEEKIASALRSLGADPGSRQED